MEPAVEIDVTVVTKGRVDAEAIDYARQKIDKTLRHGATPARRAVIHLTHEPDPARDRPFIAEATIDRDGEAIRAHVGGDAMLEAIDLLDDRLRRRIDESESRKRALVMRHRDDGPGEWRHGSVPAERPQHFVRPVEEREIVRHKSFAVTQQTIDEAVFDLETLDHDFFLFRDERTGADAVVWRLDGHYALVESDGSAPAPDTVSEVEVRAITVPTISVEPPRTPQQMDRAITGLVSGRFQWVVFTSVNAVRAVREKFDEFPGLDFNFSQLIRDNVEEALSGVKGSNSIKVFGSDLSKLEEVGDAIANVQIGRAHV